MPVEQAAILRVCRPASGTSAYFRVVNLGRTTLVIHLGTGWDVRTYWPESETELVQKVFDQIKVSDVKLYGGYQSSGDLYLPARLSATVMDGGRLPSIQYATDPLHGAWVSDARAISDVADQLPYAKLAKLTVKGSKVAACVLEAGKRLNDGSYTLQDAIQAYKECHAMVDELREWWAAKYAEDVNAARVPEAHGPPVATDDVLKSLARDTSAADDAIAAIKRMPRLTWVTRLFR